MVLSAKNLGIGRLLGGGDREYTPSASSSSSGCSLCLEGKLTAGCSSFLVFVPPVWVPLRGLAGDLVSFFSSLLSDRAVTARLVLLVGFAREVGDGREEDFAKGKGRSGGCCCLRRLRFGRDEYVGAGGGYNAHIGGRGPKKPASAPMAPPGMSRRTRWLFDRRRRLLLIMAFLPKPGMKGLFPFG